MEMSLLEKGPKFEVTPVTIPVKNTPNTTTVAALQAGELNGAFTVMSIGNLIPTLINQYLRTSPIAEYLALVNLRKDQDCITVISVKGVALVAMDKSEYIAKDDALLQDTCLPSSIQRYAPTIHRKLIKSKTSRITSSLKHKTLY